MPAALVGIEDVRRRLQQEREIRVVFGHADIQDALAGHPRHMQLFTASLSQWHVYIRTGMFLDPASFISFATHTEGPRDGPSERGPTWGVRLAK